MSFQALELLALQKLANDKAVKAARDEVGVGTHEVDFVVRVSGSLSVSEDTDRASTARLLNEATLALLIKRMGFQRDEAMKILREVALEAMDIQNGNKRKLLEETGVKEALATLKKEVVAAMPRTPVRGAVRTNLRVALTDESPEAPELPESPEELESLDEAIMFINS